MTRVCWSILMCSDVGASELYFFVWRGSGLHVQFTNSVIEVKFCVRSILPFVVRVNRDWLRLSV